MSFFHTHERTLKRYIVIQISLALFCCMVIPCVGEEISVCSAAYVPDQAFPDLIRYVWDGYDLKHGMGEQKPYKNLVSPGATLHLFFRNDSSEPVEIDRVRLNGIELNKHILPIHREHRGLHAASYQLNDPTTTSHEIRNRLDDAGSPIWYQVEPNPVPSGGYSELVIRFRNLPKKRHLEVAVGRGEESFVSRQISTSSSPVVKIVGLHFNKAIDRVFLYLRRTDGNDFELNSVKVDGADILSGVETPRKSVHGLLPLEIPLEQPWTYGSFHYFQATTEDNLTAAAMIRARDDFFALGMWGYRNYGNTDEERARDTCTAFHNHLFNTHMGMAGKQTGFLESEEGLAMLSELGLCYMHRDPSKASVRHPQLYARFLLDEPDAHEYAVDALPGHLRLGAYAQALVQRKRHWIDSDPRTLTLLNVDLTYKPHNWLTYGQLPDILSVDPYYQMRLNDVYWKHPGWLAQYCHPYYVFAISEIARWSCEPHPLHVILNSVSFREDDKVFRYGTPEEKRLEFYYALAAGAKGISYWWFTPYGNCRGCGAEDDEARAMMKEMARLNAEARSVLSLLATSCPGADAGTKVDPFTQTRPPWLITRSLFSGTHSAIIVLINRDHCSDRVGTLYQSIPKAEVIFEIPYWLDIADVFRFSNRGIEPVESSRQEGNLVVQLNDIKLTEMLIISSTTQIKEQVKETWDRLQPRLARVIAPVKQ